MAVPWVCSVFTVPGAYAGEFLPLLQCWFGLCLVAVHSRSYCSRLFLQNWFYFSGQELAPSPDHAPINLLRNLASEQVLMQIKYTTLQGCAKSDQLVSECDAHTVRGAER